MQKVNKARHVKICKLIVESGYKASHIAESIGCKDSTLSNYRNNKEGYVTEGMTSRLEKFFNSNSNNNN